MLDQPFPAFRILVLVLPVVLAGCQFIDEPAHLRAGPYAGVVAGGAIDQFDLPSGLDSETSFTYGFRGGYRFPRWVAIEVSYEELGSAEIELEFPRLDVGEVEGRTFVAQAKGYLTQAPLQPYALIGIGVIDAEIKDTLGVGIAENETETVYKLGGGLEAHSGEHLTFFVEGAWTKPAGKIHDFEYTSVLGGIMWRF